MTQHGVSAAGRIAEPTMVGYSAIGADGCRLGSVVVDLRAAYPRNRLLIEHGVWLWRHRYVVARAHVIHSDLAARVVQLDLDRAHFLTMPRW